MVTRLDYGDRQRGNSRKWLSGYRATSFVRVAAARSSLRPTDACRYCAAWIDINLMVTPTSIPLLLRALHLPSPADSAIRSATADALVETITKGMPPADKLSLLTVLDIGAVLARLIDVGRTNGAGEVNSVVEVFREKLAKILNGVGTELCKICDDVGFHLKPPAISILFAKSISEQPAAPADTKVAAMAMATSLLPLLLRFLADAHDDTSSAVFGFATAMLSVYKKEKKRGGADTSASMTPEKRAFLIELLNVTVQKMEYKADAEWTMSIEGEEDDEALQFAEMRKVRRLVLLLLCAQALTHSLSCTEPSRHRRCDCLDRPGTLRRRGTIDRHRHHRHFRNRGRRRRLTLMAAPRIGCLHSLRLRYVYWLRSSSPLSQLTLFFVQAKPSVRPVPALSSLSLRRRYSEQNAKRSTSSTTRSSPYPSSGR